MSNAQHPDAGAGDGQVLAQILTVLERLQQPGGGVSGWDLPARLQQARMQGVGALIGSATRKLREARLLAAAPCELQLLDAALDVLVGAYFLDCLATPGEQPANSAQITPAFSSARQAAAPLTWSNQHYYRFMEEVATRYADDPQARANASAAGFPQARANASAAGFPQAGADACAAGFLQPGAAASANVFPYPPVSAPSNEPAWRQPAGPGKTGAAVRSLAGSSTPTPQSVAAVRPYSRMARLRQAARRPAATDSAAVPSTAHLAASTPAATPAAAISPVAAAAVQPGAGADETASRQALNRREAENQAWADYLALAGKAIYVGTVFTVSGAATLARPMLFTVLAGAAAASVCQWQGNRLRPVWQVRPVGALPEHLKQQARLWIYGHEYDDAGRFFASGYFTPALSRVDAPAPAGPPPLAAAPPLASSRAAVEAQAVREYEAHLGRILEVQELCGYVDALGDEVIHCVPPATVRVVKTRPDYLLQWRNNELWPQWQVETVAPHSDLAQAKQLRISGPAWRASGERIDAHPLRRLI